MSFGGGAQTGCDYVKAKTLLEHDEGHDSPPGGKNAKLASCSIWFISPPCCNKCSEM